MLCISLSLSYKVEMMQTDDPSLLCSYWISQMVRSLARVLLEDKWQERQTFYVDELLEWC